MYTGRTFPENKPGKYLQWTNGKVEGEETVTPPPEEVKAGGGEVQNRHLGKKLSIQK